MQRRNFGDRRSSDFASSEQFATEVWEEEGGAMLPEEFGSNLQLSLVPKLELNPEVNSNPTSNSPGIRQEISSLGYSQEELYFYKINRDLKVSYQSKQKDIGESRKSKK